MFEANHGLKKSRVNWGDPSLPVGNAPPMPRWPLALAAAAWLAWLVFLITMLAHGTDTSAG